MPAGSKPACGAKTRQEGANPTCSLSAGWGTDHPGVGHCRLHGGNTPAQKIRAEKIRVDRDANAALAKLHVAPIEDPVTSLLQLGGQVVAWQEATADLVNKLGDQVRYEGVAGGEQLRAEVGLWERSMDRAIQVLGLIAKLNLEERAVALDERQAEQVIATIEAVLTFLGITGPQAEEARQVAVRHLRAV